MKNKLVFMVVAFSIIMAGVFTVQWFRDQNRVYSLGSLFGRA